MPLSSSDGPRVDPLTEPYRPLEAAELLPDVLDLLPIGVQVDDPQGRTVFVNDAFTRMLGYELAEIADPDDWFRLAYHDPAYRAFVVEAWQESLERLAAKGAPSEAVERPIHCKNGDVKIIEFHIRRIGDKTIYLLIDVSARHRLATELRRMAYSDSLTGIANRRSFFEMGAQLMAAAPVLSVLLFDIDHFKAVNDRHGHSVGDRVLVEIVARCRAGLEADQLLARLGGEEFAVLLPSGDVAGAMGVAERLRSAVADAPVVLGSAEVAVTLSLGVACGSEDLPDVDTLLTRADRALYAAKRAGRNRVCLFGAGSAG